MNLVPVNKKKGTIRVCTGFRDLNQACPKDNFPTPFIDQVMNSCTGYEVLSFMDGFSRYNQIHIQHAYHYKTTFTTPWGTFTYFVILFGLKNSSATSQWVITYVFHYLTHIILA
jgi:hypothetical protein